MRRHLTPDELREFLNLASALEPENLYCDGERSRTAARRVAASLRARWRALEAKVGRKVDEGEVWALHVETLRPVGTTERY